MSNPLKAIGKAFKKVVKVAKKVALPALAIGAVVLTGGAALGVLPALGGAGGLLASVGIKGALAGILTSAAKAATFGAVGSLLTGGNPIKGATTGFLIGGALGAVGAATAGAAANAAAPAADAATAATGGASVAPVSAAATVPGEAAVQAAWGVGAPASAATSTAAGGVGSVASSVAPVAASAAPAASLAVPTSSGGLGGLLSNPVVLGQGLQGIGAALGANEDAKEARRAREERYANYSGGTENLFQGARGLGGQYESANDRYSRSIYGRTRLAYDPQSGRVVPVAGAG